VGCSELYAVIVSQAAIGLELWSMSNDIVFDNFIIADSKRVVDQWAADSWRLKQSEENASSVSNNLHIELEGCHHVLFVDLL